MDQRIPLRSGADAPSRLIRSPAKTGFFSGD
jgi:hypothetical protein